jgi:hypothetical protein
MVSQEQTLSQEQVAQFQTQGFLVVPGVLDPETVAQLRSLLIAKFDSESREPGDTKTLLNMAPSRLPDLARVMGNPQFLAALRAVLGDDFVFLPEMPAMDSQFGGWHKDTSAQEMAGENFHWDPDYLMLEAAFYLQDNGSFGGGLDIVPGSQSVRDRYVNPTLLQKTTNKLKKDGTAAVTKKAYSIPNKAGDLVLFHFRADHRATQPTACSMDEIPEEHRKLGFFFACSRNTRHVALYKSFIESRADYAYLKDHSYPEHVLELAAEHDVQLA